MENLLDAYENGVLDVTNIKLLPTNKSLSQPRTNGLLLALGLFHDKKEVNKEAKKVLKKQLDINLFKVIIDTSKNFTKIKDSYNRGYNYKKALRELLEQYPHISGIEQSLDLESLAICLLKATKGSSWEFALKLNIPTKDIWNLSFKPDGVLEVAVFDQEPKGLWSSDCEKLHFLNYSKTFRLPSDIRKMKVKELEYWVAGDFTEAFYIPTLEKLRIMGSNCTLPSIPKTVSYLQSLILDVSDKNIEYLIEVVNICPNLQELKIDTINTDKSYDPDWEKIIDIVAGLKNLEKLSLEGNKLTYLPENISKLTTIKELDVSNNNLNDLPNSLEALNSLEILNVGYNKFGKDKYLSNYMPEVIFRLKNLQELRAYGYTTSYSRPAEWEKKVGKKLKVAY